MDFITKLPKPTGKFANIKRVIFRFSGRIQHPLKTMYLNEGLSLAIICIILCLLDQRKPKQTPGI